MVLRRLARLGWKQAVGDLIIVVAGILIALGVDKWNERRHERALEHRYLAGIMQDLSADTSALRQAHDIARARLRSAEQLLEAANGGTWDSEEPVHVALARAWGRTVVILNDETYRDLTALGQLKLIQDPEVRRSIRQYYETRTRVLASPAEASSEFGDWLRDELPDTAWRKLFSVGTGRAADREELEEIGEALQRLPVEATELIRVLRAGGGQSRLRRLVEDADVWSSNIQSLRWNHESLLATLDSALAGKT